MGKYHVLKRVFMISAALLFISTVAGCGQIDKGPYSQTENMSETRMVNDIIKTLDGCIPWSEIEENDVNSRNEVMKTMEKLSRCDIDVLEKAVEKYVLNKKEQNSYDVDSMSRLYVLNRYIFDVSAKKPWEAPRFGAFFVLPSEREGIVELWPLSFDDKGNLVLTGEFGGYFGESYLAVEEFKYFRKTYGVRKK